MPSFDENSNPILFLRGFVAKRHNTWNIVALHTVSYLLPLSNNFLKKPQVVCLDLLERKFGLHKAPAAFAYAPTYHRRLEEIELPILVINPDDDCREQSLRADAIMKNGRRIDFPQWGHGFLNAFPADAASVILDFIEETERND